MPIASDRKQSFRKASVTATKKRLKITGASTQPCFYANVNVEGGGFRAATYNSVIAQALKFCVIMRIFIYQRGSIVITIASPLR